ncbi:tyrosine-type recombinase/integrase [Thiohalocapsa marina]|uniref:Tyrosine-type recombinase/integrase n=1 Tax=Thiohalocapsa marina TaxID=424902 RepID=A0A5M8FB15_9GAMM|nr:tyrosine-type recombinase/integrase [Thiohalocapsa marina]
MQTAGRAESTQRAYRADWQRFCDWCESRGHPALPASPEIVAAYLAAEADAGRKVATLRRRVAAIRLAHRLCGHEPPTNSELVRATLRGIARLHGAAPQQKAPALADVVRRMVDTLDRSTLRGRRDRALLTLGFASALRRSELAALAVGDLEFVTEGVRVHVRRSKTDQEGLGQVVAVIRGGDYCPVAAVSDWIAAAGIGSGSLFRRMHRGDVVSAQPLSGHSIAAVVKRCAEACGLDPAAFGGHSLRAGFLTSAAQSKASLYKLMEVSRHTDPKSVMRYVRRAAEFEDHAGEGLL